MPGVSTQCNEDDLVWDEELGWVDPEDPLGSIGIEVIEGKQAIIYRQAKGLDHSGPFEGDMYRFPRSKERLMVIRRCIDDAIWRVENK